jgi:hypothetical protein
MSEDAALKYLLSGIQVSDGTSPARNVPVRFVNPEDELVSYVPPMILISMPSISMAFDRMGNSGNMNTGTFESQLPYAPEGYANWWPGSADSYDPSQSPYYADVQPYNLDYQITVLTRINRQHMIPILGALEMPTRLGRNATLTVPQDGTYRQIDRMGGPSRQNFSYKDGPLQKKLFTATYMIRVHSEVVGPVTDARTGGEYGFANDISIDLAYAQAIANTDLTPYYTENDLSLEDLKTSFGILGVRQNVTWHTESRD